MGARRTQPVNVWDAAASHQAPPSLGFSSQDWSGVPLPSLIPRICGSKCKTSVEKAS